MITKPSLILTMVVVGAIFIYSLCHADSATPAPRSIEEVRFNNVTSARYYVNLNHTIACNAQNRKVQLVFAKISQAYANGKGRVFKVIKTDSSLNKCFTNVTGGGTINGFTNHSGVDVQREAFEYTAGSSEWLITGSY